MPARFVVLILCSAASAPRAAAEPPAAVLDLRAWKLTLPVNTPQRKGDPDEIVQPDLETFQDPAFFRTSPRGDAVIFRAPCGGVGTPRSRYPRSELREMTPDGKDEASWSTDDDVRHVMILEEAITHLPEVKPHVVCAQVHDAKDNLLMVRLEKRKLFIETDEMDDVELDSDYGLGERFTLRIVAGGGRIKVWCNDALALDWSISRSGCYFKAGCYTQSSVAKGDRPEAYGEVAIYRLEVTHAERP